MDEKEAAKFLGVPSGSLSHIPPYALIPALEAIAKVRDLEAKNLFRPGLYYVALVDLTASTAASAHLGAETNIRRIEAFITATVEALGSIKPRNYAQFLKEVGDGSLFLFSSFDDLYDWWIKAQGNLESYNDEYRGDFEDDEWEYFKLSAKTVVHLGEVAFSEHKNPIALAVNQVFKIEKLFSAYELGATDAVRQAATPGLIQRELTPVKRKSVVLPGDKTATLTWKLADMGSARKQMMKEKGFTRRFLDLLKLKKR